ncbi:MAG: type I 3-dehydroquinate dehydratase [Holophagales bacterium]|nr:type I 3-dehydroquinate dehydratase [Holophagales bacterium]
MKSPPDPAESDPADPARRLESPGGSEVSKATLVATLTSPPSDDGDQLRELPQLGVGYLEVRADLVPELDAAWLRDRFAGGLIYTLRSKAEGGRYEGGRRRRAERLLAEAERYDLVDLEAERDLGESLLKAIPESRRLLSWHGPSTHLTGLKQRFAELSATPARFYKMIPRAAQSGDDIRCLALLLSADRDDLICFASGDIGSWTRIVAPRLGCPLVYGALGEIPGAPGQLTIEQLHRDFGLPELPPIDGLYGIVGRPVAHSLSPRLHNGAYRALGFPGVYVGFHVESFGDFWLDVVESGSLEQLGLPLRGLSVTSPYKEVALAVSGASSPRAQHIEAANTLVWHDEVWEAESTDPDGVVLALERSGVSLDGRRAAVVGCGGAGKAAAYGLQLAGADVLLVKRGQERGERAALARGLPFQPLAGFDPGSVEVVVQATALGRAASDELPFDAARLRSDAAVLDMVYGSRPTALLDRVRESGRIGIDGREMLLHQALEQFRLMTGRQLGEDLARRLLGLESPSPARAASAEGSAGEGEVG